MSDDDDVYEIPMHGPLSLVRRGGLAGLAVVAVVVPFFVEFHVNDLHFVRLFGGAFAVLLGLATAGWALYERLKKGSKRWSGLVGLLAIVGGAYHLAMSGVAGTAFGMASLFGGPSASEVQAILEERGFDNVNITETSDDGRGFSFEALRGGGFCIGSIRFEGSRQTELVTCGLPIPLAELEATCHAGEAEACASAARRLRGEATVDWPRATRLSQSACNLGEHQECFHVGVAHRIGDRGLPQNDNLAFVAYTRACEAEEWAACFNRGVMLSHGIGVVQDESAGCDIFEQACDHDHPGACGGLAECLSSGDGRPRDYERAARLYRRACDAEVRVACVNLGDLHLRGQGVEQDDATAYRLYRRACGMGSEVGCRVEARLVVDGRGTSEPPQGGVDALAAQCDGGGGISCGDLGVRLHEGRPSVPIDRARALGLFTRGCELEDAVSCRNAAIYHRDALGGAARDDAVARTFFRRACDHGDEAACRELGG